MAYYVAVEKTEKNYVALNIKRCRNAFGTSYRYDDPFACTLEEINNITTTYKDEEAFRAALTEIFSLSEEDLDKKLSILYVNNPEIRKINGNILYEDSRELIDDESNVINYILNKYQENDYKFFRQLSKNLRSDSISKSIISQIAFSIEERVTNETEKTDEENQNLKNNIITAAKLLIYKNDINEKGIVSPTNKIDYESLHSIVSFISDYEATLTNAKTSGYTRNKKPE